MQKKQGISLIVLVITIIVMIILAASVVITLSNTGVIDRAGQAVDLTNESQVQDLAALAWADAYMAGKRGTELETEVTTKLSEQGVTADKWNISVSDTGVSVTNKNDDSNNNDGVVVSTLGELITNAADYGKTVDYTVTVDGTTYDTWQIYYHNSDYVYLITSEAVKNTSVDVTKLPNVTTLTAEELALYEKFRVGNADKYELIDGVDDFDSYNVSYSCRAVVQLIRDYASFANTATYGANVVGAIGGPTIELLAAGWNAKVGTPTISLAINNYGYRINDKFSASLSLTSEGLYIPSDVCYWLASPASEDYGSLDALVCAGKLSNIYTRYHVRTTKPN